MGWDVSQTLPQKHLTLEERKYWDWNDMFFLKVTGFAFALFFMMEGIASFFLSFYNVSN